ncbi:hypothetical protein BDP81DRAFT_494528 [Colletotrichum phormii]|uniref:Uncharacterized protein n=1 Tax=Colletotrichum phormii TaxID=359342 RepID=A0AAI9ZNX0_9PEZI|nr:uncharacterized protein BDP81DRAFT_494528 [Colletotrichum phormii]KAK1634082.1 hypothetical protein BDP81DRAFT_494528 [Colletotrichum phormii]
MCKGLETLGDKLQLPITLSVLTVIFNNILISLLAAAPLSNAAAVPSAASSEPAFELISEVYEAGQMVTNPDINIGAPVTSAAEKREHAECWNNMMTTRQNQEAYIDDCENIAQRLSTSNIRITLPPGRAEDRCQTFEPYRATLGVAAQSTMDHCPSLAQHSGWGYLTGNRNLIYIVEPLDVSPPTYSPGC